MTWLRVLLARSLGFFTGKKADRELNEEIHAHLEMLEEENRRRGMTSDDARNAALREFGGVAQMRETYREINGLGLVESFIQDVRYALRMMRRNPGFAIIVILLLALGIGVNTAIFSAIDAVMLRLLPMKDPQRLVMLYWASQNYPRGLLNGIEGGGGVDRGSGGPNQATVFSYSTFLELRDANRVFSDTFAFAGNNTRINVGLSDRAEAAIQQGVSGNYFAGLGIHAALGRTIQPHDDQEPAPPVAVLSYSFWQQKLGGNRSILDKTIIVNGNPITIIGVTPPEFFGLEPGTSPDFWVPLHLYSGQMRRLGNLNNGLPYLQDPLTWWVQIIGRLKPGINEAQARAELDLLFQRSMRATGGAAVSPDRMPGIHVLSIKQGLDTLRFQYSRSLLLMLAMAGMVLLIACFNLAALLLARATARQKEIALRLSLGAQRFRIIRQLLTESALFAALGGAVALLFALWADSALAGLLSSGRSPLNLELRLNGPVLAFTAVASILSGILFGLAPALRATRTSVAVLKPGTPLSGNRFMAGKILTGAQIALSLVLIISAGLLLRTLRDLKNVNLGFDRQQLMLFNVAPGLNGYKDARLVQYYRELQRHIESIPGVLSASFSTRAPVGEGTGTTGGFIPGYLTEGVDFYRHVVGPEYFDTLRIPVVLGRAIDAKDDERGSLVAVINQKLARLYFHRDNPVGHKIVMGIALAQGGQKPEYEIVGVVQDARYGGLRTDIRPTVYFSYLQFRELSNFMTFEVRGGGDMASLAASIRREALALDRNVPLTNLNSQTEVIGQMLVLERTFASLSTAFAALALLLACIGLYGSIAYTVARRTNEIGVRMALGAKRGTILGMVLRETLTVVATGLALGFPLAWFASLALQSQLYGLTAHDPITLLLATLIIAAVTAIAGYIPARRASRVDPMVALRYE